MKQNNIIKKSKVGIILKKIKDLNINQKSCEEAHYKADRLLVALVKHLGINSIMIQEILDEYAGICKHYGIESDE